MTKKRVPYKLYELSDRLTELNDLIENLEGIDIPAELHNEYLEILQEASTSNEQFINKIDSIVGLIQSRKRWLEIRKIECERLQKLVKKDEKTVEWLTKYLMHHLTQQGLTKLRTKKFNLGIRQASITPLILTEADVNKYPEKYQRVTIEIDKQQLKEDIKQGLDLSKYAHLGEKSTYLSIR